MIHVNGTRKSCVYTLCATHPCHQGTCVAHSPTKYTCHCPDGYRGHRCETALAVYHEDVGLSFSSLFAICMCFIALLGEFPEGVYHVSAHHDGWEDIRENVLNYDEEGGGEEDQNAYDMAELQKSLQPSPAQSVQYCHMRALHHPVLQLSQTQHHHQYHNQYHHLLHQHQAQPALSQAQSQGTLSRTNSSTTLPPSVGSSSSCSNNHGSASCSSSVVTRDAVPASAVRRDVTPTRLQAQGQTRPLTLARRSLTFSSQDLARYLCEIIRDTDQHPDAGPFDSLQVFSTEGGGSPAGSLSSFSSAGLECGGGGSDTGVTGGEGKREETLADWGPCFEKLRALYERPETSDL
ncbi:hypothetical protein NHX12_006385 [Muraenolepis orangiensis]|uniref:EGF-like domain-containing protein n=1 Tax=Muraenolepis orangiensis TaxID=630683 RepID=A0A9Q0DTD8_9TELE|nr:hypothetical protein NHX12_006385 [Muraenolepis orangiensis]